MSYQAVESVMKYSRTKAEARLVLMVIATHASADTFTASAGYELISSEANLSERTLIRYIKELEKTGELLIARGNGKGHFTRYTIALPQVTKADNSIHPLEAERVTGKGDKIAPVEPQRVANEPSKGDKIEPKGDKTTGAYKDIEPLGTIEPLEENTQSQIVNDNGNSVSHSANQFAGLGEFTANEEALRLAKRLPMLMSLTVRQEIQQVAEQIGSIGSELGGIYQPNPDRIARLPDYFSAQKKHSWGLSWIPKSWGQFCEWLDAEKKGKTNGNSTFTNQPNNAASSARAAQINSFGANARRIGGPAQTNGES